MAAELPFKPSPLAAGLGALFGAATAEHQAVAAAVARASPRGRTRLIDLDPALHCSIIGTCLATGPLRKCVGRHTGLERERASDHEVHHAAVELASRPGEAGKAIHKLLDETHAAMLRRFARAADADAVLAFWLEAVQQGDIPGAYWAVMTHPEADDAVRRRAFGDVHMLSHLVGASNRADIRRLAQLEARHADDQAGLDAQQQRWEAGCRAHEQAVARLEAELATARARARKPAEAADDEASALRRSLAQAEERLAGLAGQRAQAERAAAAAGSEIERLGAELAHARDGAADLGRELAAIEAHLRGIAQRRADDGAAVALAGKSVLYVGGRPSSNASIRAIAARWGLALAMHDGGIEDRKGLLAAALAKADVVVFPVDCIDHDSMNELKRRCLQRGVPFHALRSAGAASFVALIQGLDANGRHAVAAPARDGPPGCLHHRSGRSAPRRITLRSAPLPRASAQRTVTTPSNGPADGAAGGFWEQIGAASDEPICAFDTSFRLIAFNPAHNAEFFRVNGFETRIGDVFPDLFVEAQRPVMRSLMARALTGEAFTVVEEFGNPDIAAPRWEISYRPLRDAMGNVVGAFHRARDLGDSPIRAQSLVRLADVARAVDDAHFRRILQALDERLRDVETPEVIAHLCAEVVGAELRASGAGFGTMLADGETLVIARDWVAAGATSVVGTHRLAEFGDSLEVLRRGDDFVVNDVAIDRRTAHREAGYAGLGVRSAVNIPILENGRYVAMFFVLAPEPRSWAPAELAFIRNVGERARLHVERRRAEAALRALTSDLERQVRQRTLERDRLWETSEDLLAHADFAGRFFRFSPSWARTLGHAEHFLAAGSYLALVHPEDAGGLRQALELLRTGGQPMRHTLRLRHLDGSWRTIDWSMVADPDDLGFHAVGRDVSAELEAERARASLELQLQQAQKMEAVGQLTGGLAHDFNNLLASLSGNLQLMKKRLARGETEDLERRVDAGMDAVRRAATLTQRLLAFSRRQPLQAAPTDLARLVAGMEALIRGAIGPALELEVGCAADLWPVEVDRSQLEGALLNLCINARDAMAALPGGRLRIVAANESGGVQGLAAGDHVRLSVADTGAGIPAEIRGRIFDPFFTTKPMGEGTGLGLSMVYGFVRQSNGQVRIESEVGRGTTMSLYFPRFHGTVPAERPLAAVAQAGAAVGGRILVVEDEAPIRKLLVEVLGEEGYAVTEAAEGASAVGVLRSPAPIDLLLTDVGLPGGMSGRQVAEAARAARPGLKVLFLTGYAENASEWSAQLEAGMQLMTKPFEIPALLAKVRELAA